MKKFLLILLMGLVSLNAPLTAQQLPNSDFEDWSGEKFDGVEQPKSWNFSNVTQVGMQFNFAHREKGHSGNYCAMAQDQEVGALGITEVSPSYITLGRPWVYLESITKINQATAGTYGGISWTYRPDSMQVWVKRTGNNVLKEDFHLLYYAWKGTAKGNKYKGKNGSCTSVEKIDEESDIRRALNRNECGTTVNATQIAEGWVRERKEYADWTCFTVPIYYINDEVPEKCNVIFSASNYPNFRANSGLYAGNSLYVDDVKLIYSSQVQCLYIDGKKWNGFVPTMTEEQTYSLGEKATAIPEIYAVRGEGSLTNSKGETVNFPGRRLSGSEITINHGVIDGAPTTIIVQAEDGSSTTTYKIKFVRAASTNSRLGGIKVNGVAIPNFNAYTFAYTYELPYGTTATPTVEVIPAEDAQTVSITQATSTTGKATIKVTAADKKTTSTYTIQFAIAKLDDNTLKDILIDGESLKGFLPTKNIYTVELPLGTTAVPTITPVSAYKTGEQTITATNNGLTGTYTINVSVPGNATTRTYKLNFKITASSFVELSDLQVEGYPITFNPGQKVYYVSLPLGTTTLPTVKPIEGDKYQTITQSTETNEEGQQVVKILVTAANGDQLTYKVIFDIQLSDNSYLTDIKLDGKSLPGFASTTNTYDVNLPVGTTTLPTITYTQGDEFQTVTVSHSAIDPTDNTAKTRVTVTAGNGMQNVYVINYTIATADNTTLTMIYVDGEPISGFVSSQLTYDYTLPSGTKSWPTVTYDQHDEYQTVTAQKGTFSTTKANPYTLSVKSGSGTIAKYIITFTIAAASSNTDLAGIKVGGTALEGFEASTYSYSYNLPEGTTKAPTVAADKAETAQTVQITQATSVTGKATIKVTAADKKTIKTYTIQFAVAKSSNVTLSAIKVGGTPLSGFNVETLEYTVQLPMGTTVLPTVTFTKGDASQTVTPRDETTNMTGDYKLVVTAQSGDTRTYVIHFSVATSSNATLNMIYVGGTAVAGFTSSQSSYTISLPEGTAAVPAITFDKGDSYQTVTVNKGTLTTETEIVVKAADGKTSKIYTLTFTVQKNNNTTLNAIYVGGTKLENYNPNTTLYNYDLLSNVTQLPAVTYDKAAESQSVLVRTDGMSGLTGDYKLVVTAQSGDTRTYTIHFEVVISSNANLQAIYLDGKILSSFNPGTLDYTVNLPIGTTEAPAITWQVGDEFQMVSTSFQGLEGRNDIVVTAQNGSKRTYSIRFAVVQSTNSQLSMISVGGVNIPSFDPDVFEYTVSLPVGTTAVPAITYVKNVESQQVTVVYGSINTDTRVIVKAENGDQQVYVLYFDVAQSADATLSMIRLDGTPLMGYSANTYSYVYAMPIGSTACPTITVDKATAGQMVSISQPKLTGDAVISVTSEDGMQHSTYTVTFKINDTRSDVSTLAGIQINGAALDGFDPATYIYNNVLPAGTSVLPAINPIKGQAGQTVYVTRGTIKDTTFIRVLAENQQQETIYKVCFSVEVSSSAELAELNVDGVNILVPGQYYYEQSFGVSQTSCPQITVVKGEESQNVLITTPKRLGDAVVTVKAASGATQTYTIHFSSNASNNVTLTDIKVGGTTIDGFDPAVTYYDINLPVGTTALPTIETTKAVSTQTVQVLSAGPNAPTTIYVTAEDGTSGSYTLNFVTPLEDNVSLSSIQLDGAPLAGFSATKYEYDYVLAAGTTAAPVVTATAATSRQTLTIVQPKLTGDAQVIVRAEDGTEQTYTIHINFRQFSDATLKEIRLDGALLPGFAPTKYDYNLTISTAQAEGPMELTYVEQDSMQTIMMVNNGMDGAKIIVRSETGAQQQYTINYSVVQSDYASLAGLRFYDATEEKFVDYEDFDPATFTYTEELARHTTAVPAIYPIKSYDAQIVTITYGKVNEPTTIEVTAETGATATYTINFPVAKSSNTQLGSLMLFGNNCDVTQTAHVCQLPQDWNYDPSDLVAYEKAEQEQSIEYVFVPHNQTSTIKVIAENGDELTYTITFAIEQPKGDNILTRLYIKEIDQELSLKDKTKRNFDVELPYGARTMTVEYDKNYPEQTVFVQPGGVNHPTILTVKSNKAGVADEVYTLTPIVPTADPAVLTDIKVNGTTISGFNSEQFSYIVPVTGKPTLKYVINKGAEINITYQSSKHWQAEVSYGDRTNVYDVWYYYTNDVIPNGEFTEWTSCTTYTSAQKPKGWNTVADALGKHSGFGNFTPDQLVTKQGTDIVHLSTKYSTPGGGEIPGFITLGKVTGKWGVAGSTNIDVSGSISFHNSPDQMKIRYYSKSVQDNNLIQYTLSGSDGEGALEWKEGKASTYSEHTYDLSAANAVVGDPTQLNITLCSYYTIGATTASSSPEMFVDWVRIFYNHTLSGLKVNGATATLSGSKFSSTLADPEYIERPQLTFIGEVADQAQTVAWGEETISDAYGVRAATVRNFAENGTDYTDYTLEVKRPLDTKATLDSLYIGGVKYVGFDPATLDYTIDITPNDSLPDIYPFPGSSRQTVVTTLNGKVMSIEVTPEYGAAQTYTITFNVVRSSDVTISLAMEGITFDPATTTYDITAAAWPELTFLKNSDGQTLTYTDQPLLRKLTVLAEDGVTSKTYTISRTLPQTVSGKMLSFRINGAETVITDGVNSYDTDKEVTSGVAFARAYSEDAVVEAFNENNITWVFTAVDNTTTNTYSLNFTKTISDDATLGMIYVDGAPIEGFNASVTGYDYASTVKAYRVQAVANAPNAVLDITYTNKDATIVVTSEDGKQQKTYTVTFKYQANTNSQLAMIYLDGTPLTNFHSTIFDYNVELESSMPKFADSKMPNITFAAGAPNQTIAVTNYGVGGGVYIDVTAESGATSSYVLNVTSTKASDAKLAGLYVNGKSILRDDRYEYNVVLPDENDPLVEYFTKTVSPFQDVTYNMHTTPDEPDEIIVTAENGNSSTYLVNFTLDPTYHSANLEKVYLDGVEMADFRPDIYTYNLKLPAGTAVTPVLTAVQANDLQVVVNTLAGLNETSTITVTAPDGITEKTYTFYFGVEQSSNADLLGISVDYSPIADFDPNVMSYSLVVEGSTYTIQYVQAEVTQRVIKVQDGDVAKLIVIAQDGTTKTYSIHLTTTVSAANNADLSGILVDGEPLAGFAPNRTEYTLHLPVGSTTVPMIQTTSPVDNQTITITGKTLADTTNIHVVAEDGVTNKDYRISYTIARSAVDTLRMIYLDNAPLDDFSATQLSYDVTLPVGTTFFPTISYSKGDGNQSVMVNMSSMESSAAGYDIVVTAENGAQRVYHIDMHIALSTLTTLRNILINGETMVSTGIGYTANADFAETLYDYSLQWAIGTVALPQITYTAGDEFQSISYLHTMSSINDSVVIRVTAQDGNYSDYIIRSTLLHSDVDTLKMIYVNNQPIENFSNQQDTFYVDLAVGTRTIPEYEVVKGDQWQTITTKALSMTTYETVYQIHVSAEAGNARDYYLVFRTAKSDLTSLKNIRVNGLTIETAGIGYTSDYAFAPDQLTYHLTWEVGTNILPEVTYTAGDEYQSISFLNTMRSINDSLLISVTAENGDKQTYTIYSRVAHSAVDTLRMIYVNGVELADFDAQMDTFVVELPVGTTQYPSYEVLRGEQWQTVTERIVSAGSFERTDFITVVAEDGVTTRNYTLIFRILKSQVATLNHILVNGYEFASLADDKGFATDNAFSADCYEYHLTWDVGTTAVPVFTYEQTDAFATTQVLHTPATINDSLVLRVYAQSGDYRTYRVYNQLLHSDVDTLAMIYSDASPIEGFDPYTTTYVVTLPVGTRQFPLLEYQVGEEYQQVSMDTLVYTTYEAVFRINVVAENGIGRRTYKVQYTILKSDKSYLEAIYLNGAMINSFRTDSFEYTYYIPAGIDTVPLITYDQADRFQTVQLNRGPVDGDTYLTVTAEDGSQSVYTIHFPILRSSNAYLNDIQINGVSVTNYDKEQLTYRIALPYGTTNLPRVTYVAGEEEQTVTLNYDPIAWTASITVVAANGTSTNTYVLTFLVARSSDAALKMITLDGQDLDDFAADQYEYSVTLPYGTPAMPEVGYQVADTQQVVTLTPDTAAWKVTLTVQSGDAFNTNEYIITFVVEKNFENRLIDLRIDTATIEGFDAEILDYDFTFPAGTDSSALITEARITAVPMAEDATVAITTISVNLITITVTAANGDQRIYTITQDIALPDNSLLKSILLDSMLIDGFDPSVFSYEYRLPQGTQTIPAIIALAQDSLAEINITPGIIDSIPYRIFCTAQNGDESVYEIMFATVTYSEAKHALPTDVLFRHIAGTNRFMAASIRLDVQIAVFDQSGHMLMYSPVPTCDPNAAEVTVDLDGVEHLNQVTDPNQGVCFEAEPNRIYFYTFFESDKRRVTSGKFMLVP